MRNHISFGWRRRSLESMSTENKFKQLRIIELAGAWISASWNLRRKTKKRQTHWFAWYELARMFLDCCRPMKFDLRLNRFHNNSLPFNGRQILVHSHLVKKLDSTSRDWCLLLVLGFQLRSRWVYSSRKIFQQNDFHCFNSSSTQKNLGTSPRNRS